MNEQENLFIDCMLAELARARKKFPNQDALHTLAALTEETGELAQAVLHLTFEPGKMKTSQHVFDEAVQVAVMALRVALDCGLIELDKARYHNTPVEKVVYRRPDDTYDKLGS
jgi:NTP pyrophosphatase (non-canonical NTP hydrolase)